MATVDTNIISIKCLQLPAGIVAPDVWGKLKEQPALVSVKLVLRGKGFSSAASKDELDESTLHYGQLAKSIRARCSRAEQRVSDVSTAVNLVVESMATKRGKIDGKEWSSFVVAHSIVDVVLPKASMAGEKVTVTSERNYDEAGGLLESEGQYVIDDVKVMTLVGVNGYERTAKQPLVARLGVSWPGDHVHDLGIHDSGTGTLWSLEGALIEVRV